jgi:pimeloyl-ACP methyl ester carboxylesterase
MEVNGTVLHYRQTGDHGTAVVFVHGSLGDLDDWRAQEDVFSREHRVLVYSRRYHPPNAPQADQRVYTPALHAEDLAVLLQALGLGPASIVGSGYGAATSLALALEHPDLVRALVLVEPPIIQLLGRTPAGDTLRRALVDQVLDPARAALGRGDSLTAVRLFVDGINGSPGTFNSLSPAARARVLAHTFELRRELFADRREYQPVPDCARLGRLPTPVLLLQGERSPRMYRLINDELARCLQSDTTITIPAAGHLIQSTNPAYFNAIVLHYLQSH